MRNVLSFIFVSVLCLVPAFAVGESDSEIGVVSDSVEEPAVEVEVLPTETPAESEMDSSSDSEALVEVQNGESGSADDGATDVLSDYDTDNPLPVTLVESDDSYPTVYSSGNGSVVVIGDAFPQDPPFYGSGYITGYSDDLGTVTLYFPIDYSSGRFGVDANGYLISVYSSSMSGYLEGVYNNSVSVPAFSYPRYRNASGYDYTNIYLTPTDSNMDIAVEMTPSVTIDEVLPYVLILVMGVSLVCFMKRW